MMNNGQETREGKTERKARRNGKEEKGHEQERREPEMGEKKMSGFFIRWPLWFPGKLI